MESLEPVFTLLRVIVALAAVLALIWLFGRRLAKRNHTLTRGRIRTVARQGLGPRQSVQVLDIDQRRYVLGIADHSVSMLDSYPVPEAERATDDTDAAAAPESFDQHLTAAQTQPRQSPLPAGAPTVSQAVEMERLQVAAQAEPAPQWTAGVKRARGGGSILSSATWRQALEAIRRGPQR